jgi:hypothetical protein
VLETYLAFRFSRKLAGVQPVTTGSRKELSEAAG